MTSQQVLEEINTSKATISDLEAELDELKSSAWSELSIITRAWINAEVGRTIADNAPQIQALGMDRLQAIKTAVDALETDFRVWIQSHRSLPTFGEDVFDYAFKSMAGSLGGVWAHYGLMNLHAHDNKWARSGDNWMLKIGPSLTARGAMGLISAWLCL